MAKRYWRINCQKKFDTLFDGPSGRPVLLVPGLATGRGISVYFGQTLKGRDVPLSTSMNWHSPD
jgi:hypothetical protein